MKIYSAVLSSSLLLAAALVAHTSSIIPLSTANHVQVSDAVFRGTVVGMSSFKDAGGLIFTRTSIRVDEPLKGKFPAVLQVVHRGGQVGNEDDFYGLSPRLVPGREYLLFLTRQANGTLECALGYASAFPLRHASAQSPELVDRDQSLLDEVRQLTQKVESPGADVTDQAVSIGPTPEVVTGLLTNSDNQSSRFLQPDRGEPIPYIIDADSYPSALTLAQATNAVQQALNAWSAVTSLKFRFDGFQSFGTNASAVAINDERLRIQLHDLYNQIKTANVLGIGGRFGSSNSVEGAGWNVGGNVGGNEFWKTLRGYVVLKSTNSALNSPATFAEVLCHEIGHALSMAHSSEDSGEANTTLKEAIMYYKAHQDGRGATLGTYDPPIIRQAYPSNTPPFMFSRVMDIVTASSRPVIPGINKIELRGYDLQTTNLTLVITNATTFGGTFSLNGSKIGYSFDFPWSDSERLDPADNGFYDTLYARVSDGSNASPYVTVSVLSYSRDFSPAVSDGIPDNWMIAYFGNANPATGLNHRSTNDLDADGLSNLNEFIAGTNPTNKDSAQRILSIENGTLRFQAKAYELYEVLGSTNLTNWVRIGVPVLPINAPLEVRTNLFATNIIATVPNLPSGNPFMFFRVVKVP